MTTCCLCVLTSVGYRGGVLGFMCGLLTVIVVC